MRANTFHCFTLHRLDTFCWFGVGCVVWGGCLVCLVCFLFFFCAQSVRPRYQSMTSIAYLHDCHCCHNERSIVQKKKSRTSPAMQGKKKKEDLIRSMCGNSFHPGLIGSALGGNEKLRQWIRQSLEGTLPCVANRETAYRSC